MVARGIAGKTSARKCGRVAFHARWRGFYSDQGDPVARSSTRAARTSRDRAHFTIDTGKAKAQRYEFVILLHK